MPDIESVGYGNWFGGFYQDPKNQFAQFAVDVPTFFQIYPEVLLPADQRAAFERERTACIIGRDLAKKYGWKLGDVVPITGTIYPGDWRLTVRGIYAGKTEDIDENTIFFNWDYLNEAMPEGRKNWVGIYWLKIKSASQAPGVSDRVDAMFENSPQPTKTETEKAFQAGFISMMGNVSMLLAILGSAIVFAIVLVTVNTMMMAARSEPRNRGLKTLGFTNGLICVGRGGALILSVVGGLLGAVWHRLFRNVDFTRAASSRIPRPSGEVGYGMLSRGDGPLSGVVPAIRPRGSDRRRAPKGGLTWRG